ncbi:hypothetical protein CANCADRAFT_58593 [Tortispora caseinolytica NRRL Y-17796]|uniref:Lactam utilization protein lamB n=1 Tax=Tortispora caseinolytica NRRL Y-17796 TaxID=767744 RepID=A0A1E4TDA2_9ASCO|nr:hypothetical protein CANCADRAFT_58593 [Tortispora caseinolytica NRRL Y-17796]
MTKRYVHLNCDMGEGYGIWKLGPDEELMPLIKSANIACGFHGSDPMTMVKTVRLAKKHGVPVGAHPSFPDREGFGRRRMIMTQEEIKASVLYQVGALCAILQSEDIPLNHIKPHGALYIESARDEEYCDAVMAACATFKVPVYGIKGSFHEKYCKKYGIKFIPEAYPDVNFADDGSILSLTIHGGRPTDQVKDALRQILYEDTVDAKSGKKIQFDFANEPEITVCLHSDLPDAVLKAQQINELLAEVNA